VLPYPEVLRLTWRAMAATFGLPGGADQEHMFAASCGNWQPVPDTVAALQQLSSRFALAALSNVNDASLSRSPQLLQSPFLLMVSAEDIGSYRPGLPHFAAAIRRLAERGYPKESIRFRQRSRRQV
jgi:2-haloacid dehalogenase